MLKVLYLPIGDQPGMVDAFNNLGVQLEVYDFFGAWERTHNKNTVSQQFLDRVKNFQPHLIHMQLQFTGLLEANIVAEAKRLCPGVKITNWSGDVRATANASFVDVSHALDISLISSTGQLDLYRNAGCQNIKYWQIGYSPKVSFPMDYKEFRYDVSFVGNNYGTNFPDGNLRVSVSKALTNAFGTRFGLFGSGYSPNVPSIAYHQTNDLYNRSVCALSISNFNSVSHYFSDRLLACLSSGRPTISWHFPGFESYFTEGQDIFIARSAQEVIDIVNYCKNNPEIANQVGINGYKRVFEEHTFTSRVIELLHMTNLIHMV